MPRKLTPLADRFWRYVDRRGPDECWLWHGLIGKYGYGRIRLAGAGSTQTTVHRASWIIHRGPVPDGQMVLHKCDVRACVNPSHMFLGTHDDNMADMLSKGRQARGERQRCAKLNADEVRQIRASREMPSVLSARFGVSGQMVWRIRTRLAWKHVE